MTHYFLAPSRVVTHAVLEAPGEPYGKRARVTNGPWRYTEYHLIVFLLTSDGVRHMAADLDLATGTFHDYERMNYRFDAVSLVRVNESDTQERNFELGLVCGTNIQLRVTEPAGPVLELHEDAASVSAATKDAAGLANTIDVLEGVAAEGKGWIRRR
jgi:hypothetical protein